MEQRTIRKARSFQAHSEDATCRFCGEDVFKGEMVTYLPFTSLLAHEDCWRSEALNDFP